MILFVCTGNTCRSPMACALARAAGIDADSAGLSAYPGSPATPQAIRAARRHGGDLSAHRAKQADRALLERADMIWVMTEEHRAALCAFFPEYARRVRVLEPAIPDPFGGSDETYERCIQSLLLAMGRCGILPAAKG